MAQGKLKVKSKLPGNAKTKKNKGPAVTKRNNKPMKPKNKCVERNKMKNLVTKMVNKKAEEEIRSMSVENSKTMSEAQKAVIRHNTRELNK